MVRVSDGRWILKINGCDLMKGRADKRLLGRKEDEGRRGPPLDRED